MDIVKTLLIFVAQIAAWYAILGIVERFFPAGPHKSLKGWVLNFEVLATQLVGGFLLGGISAYLAELASDVTGGGLLDLRIPGGHGLVGAIGGSLLALCIYDFFYYWYHRMQHEHKALWAIHKLHHMDETIGVSTNGRVSWLEIIGHIPFTILPMALLFNLSPTAGGLVGFFIGALGIFNHANVKLPLGRFSRIINGPQLHRIHHSRLPQHFDRNYASFLPIYDILFGTYYHPKRDEFPPTGVRTDPEVKSLKEAELLPVRAWGSLLGIRARGCTGVLWCERVK